VELTRMSNDRIPMSKEGYEKKKAQLDFYKNEEMPRIAEQIALARGFGDLSENAEFDAAVEAQGMLQARINDLQNMLGQAYIVEKSSLPTDRVVYGSKVRVLDLSINEEEDFILVGPGEEDYDQNKILLTSPIGQGLVGKKVGEQVDVQIPRGVLKLKIVEIGVA
jgi:transcription elongation factor GreA